MITANRHTAELPVYEPGRPIEDVAREFGLDPAQIIKLASNENPLGPSPKALVAMTQACARSHIYPDGNGFLLRSEISKRYHIDIHQIVLGNGSNEIIEFLGHAYLNSESEIVISQYAFAIYEMVAKLFQARVIEVPAIDFGHNLGGMLKAITPRTRLVFIANPNNPTGTEIQASQLRQFIEKAPKSTLLVIDEAYQEFLEQPLDTHRMIKNHPNLVIMRTFSKAQGLAGLRIGFGMASSEVAASLQRVRQPFQANSIAQAAALAALTDDSHIKKTVDLIRTERLFLEKELGELKLNFVPSSANFILIKVGHGKEIFDRLLREGIIVRPMDGYRLPEWIRVTIGTHQENQTFIRTLRKILG
jgi:histidinol-phosphate aminotransferase